MTAFANAMSAGNQWTTWIAEVNSVPVQQHNAEKTSLPVVSTGAAEQSSAHPFRFIFSGSQRSLREKIVVCVLAYEAARLGINLANSTEGFSDLKIVVRIAVPTERQWFIEALRLDSIGETARALDLAYEAIDGWLREGDFPRCDKFLRETDIASTPSRILLAILTVTYPASNRLPSRQAFFDRTWKTMEARGKDVHRLLGRLRAKHGASAKRSRFITATPQSI